MSAKRLRQVRQRFSDEILGQACQRFGFARPSLEPLEGSAFVYQGFLDEKARILKITPGVHANGQVMGSTREQLLGEIDFVHHLADHGLPVALPVASRAGEWVELIPIGEKECFLVTCFEKVPGFMYPDDEVVEFPNPVLVAWGRLLGQLHRLSTGYRPSNPAWKRLSWEEDDLLDYRNLIPADRLLVRQRYQELIAALKDLPCDLQAYGLIHGDFHHGNFFVNGRRIIAFDFDAACYSWYLADIVIALYNCLPMPRLETAKRREFAIHFLSHLLKGYALEKPLDPAWKAQLPLFLKWNEIRDFSHKHKYWNMDKLTDRRRAILADMRRRIENEIPVVEFQPGDLDL